MSVCTVQQHWKHTHAHTYTHKQAQDCSLLVAPRGYTASPGQSSQSGPKRGWILSRCSFNFTNAHSNVNGVQWQRILNPSYEYSAQRQRRGVCVCVANMRELHEGAYITHDLSLALMGVFTEFSWYLNQRAGRGDKTARMMSVSNYWTFPYSPVPVWKCLPQANAEESPQSWEGKRETPRKHTHPHQPKSLKWGRNRRASPRPLSEMM